MSSFDDRKKGYENKFAHDEEVAFKIKSKCNKLLGKWAAEKLHLDAKEIEGYAVAVMESALDGDVYKKILQDFANKGIGISKDEVERERERILANVKEEYK